jgi:hypothetical protein
MNIEEKLAFVRKALEMGANVELVFHNVKEEEVAEQVAAELSQLTNLPYQSKANGSTRWFKIDNYDQGVEATVFYDDEYLEEDIDFTGGEEHATA